MITTANNTYKLQSTNDNKTIVQRYSNLTNNYTGEAITSTPINQVTQETIKGLRFK